MSARFLSKNYRILRALLFSVVCVFFSFILLRFAAFLYWFLANVERRAPCGGADERSSAPVVILFARRDFICDILNKYRDDFSVFRKRKFVARYRFFSAWERRDFCVTPHNTHWEFARASFGEKFRSRYTCLSWWFENKKSRRRNPEDDERVNWHFVLVWNFAVNSHRGVSRSRSSWRSRTIVDDWYRQVYTYHCFENKLLCAILFA